MAKKPPKITEVLKELPSQISNDVLRYGLSKRRLEFTRCDRCMGKVKVSAGILLRIAHVESRVVCGKCLGTPGEPEEILNEQQQGPM